MGLCMALLVAVRCQQVPGRREPIREFHVRLLSEAESLRTSSGDGVAGYVAEYTLDFERHLMFTALELQKYEKGERLAVKGVFKGDTVRVSTGEEGDTELPVFVIFRAQPDTSESAWDRLKEQTAKRPAP
jgi:hypothetical protein